MRKRFDQQLFNTHDDPARRAIIQHLHDQGIFARNNEDKYGPDILVLKGFKVERYIECEIKLGWKEGEFPFPTVNLPERKGRYTRKKLPIDYWILRSDLQAAVIIPGPLVRKDYLVEVPNRLVSQGELFYQIPIELCAKVLEILPIANYISEVL